MSPIDFVVSWVDGDDNEWRKLKNKYLSEEKDTYYSLTNEARYRSWDNLHLLFRGIEKYAGWVNKIYLITPNQIPKWLNIQNEKIVLVDQNSFIPQKYLPTFNINTIECNMHRIQGLSDQFVYFNDDMFLIDTVNPSDFFRNGIPVDTAILAPHCYGRKSQMSLVRTMAIGVINDNFEYKKVLRENILKWFTPIYGKGFLQNIVLAGCPRFPGIQQHHLPTPLLKKTFDEVWNAEPDFLDTVCNHKFRNVMDTNQWVFREWQLAKGEFYPRNNKLGRSYVVDKEYDKIIKSIRNRIGKVICINDVADDDSMTNEEFEAIKRDITKELENNLPDKSGYEL